MEQNKREPKELWQEPKAQALAWKPCADQRSWSPDGRHSPSLFFFCFKTGSSLFPMEFSLFIYFSDFLDGENGYIMVTANGGINQQRVAVSILLLCPSSCLLKFLYHHIMRPRDTFHRYVISLL